LCCHHGRVAVTASGCRSAATQPIVQIGSTTAVTELKSDAAGRVIALDTETNARLMEYQTRQEGQRRTRGPGWTDTGTTSDTGRRPTR
jgi:hypothetical protein